MFNNCIPIFVNYKRVMSQISKNINPKTTGIVPANDADRLSARNCINLPDRQDFVPGGGSESKIVDV